jgi:outer membrane protein assembly factor BamB
MTKKRNVLSLLLCVAFGGSVGAETIGWRHDGTGTFPDATPPKSWSKDEGVVWKTALPGKSNASPVLSGDRIFICSEPDILLCLDRNSGEILWQQANPAIGLLTDDEKARFSEEEKEARAINDEYNDKRRELGRMQWQFNKSGKGSQEAIDALSAEVDALEAKRNQYPLFIQYDMPAAHDVNGRSTPTPVTDGSHVYALFGTGVAVCYDVEGTLVWQKLVETPNHPKAWGHSASPVLADGKLIVHIRDLVALDAATGDKVWRTETPARWGSSIATSVGGETVLITPAGSIVRANDGEILQSGVADLEYCTPVVHEGTAYFIQNGGKAIGLPATADGDYVAKWTVEIRKDRYYASPVVHDGLIYTMTRNNNFSVIDAATGEVVQEKKLSLGSGDAYPSIALAGGYLYVNNSNGRTAVFKPGREVEEVATCELERFQCSPVFAGKRMYVRTWENMYCIGE